MMFGSIETVFSTLSVVPIVVNAGAVLLPAMLAGLTTILAVLFKPREWGRVCREKPAIPISLLTVTVIVVSLILFFPAGGSENKVRKSAALSGSSADNSDFSVSIDWAQIALARINARKNTLPTASSQLPAAMDTAASLFIFRGDSRRTGSIGRPITEPLRFAWRYYPCWVDENGVEQQDTEAMILSSPASYGDRIIGASCFLDPPDNYGAIFCLDAATGKQIWSFDQIDGKPMKGFFSSPAITDDGKYILIGQGLHPDSNCRLICIQTTTGQIHWTVQVALHIESSPVIDGDMVYVGCGAIEDPATHKALSHPGFVLAVRISDGKELWRYDITDPESSPAVKNNVLYIGSGFNGNAVAALRTESQEELSARGVDRLLWKTPTPYPITGAITLLDNKVIVGGGNGDFVYRDPNPAGVILALDQATGDILWQKQTSDAILGAIAAGKFLICPVASGHVVALDSQNGQQQWIASISGRAPILGAPAVTDNRVFAVSQDGYLACLDINTGQILEKQYVNSTDKPGAQGLCISSPLIVQGRLYIGSETGGLCCYAGQE